MVTSFAVGDDEGQTITEFFDAIESCLQPAVICFAESAWPANNPSFAEEVEVELAD